MEVQFIDPDPQDMIGVFMIIIVVIQSIAYIGLCQISLAVSYVCLWVYVTVRFNYLDLEEINSTNKAKISVSFFLSFLFIFLFQRHKQWVGRDEFI